ncbi:FG-GAP repeat domain-containing protein [Frankia sp. CiP1_Cm_nod1]|uniref:FG-GAP repeat domain-containing protein n=1 Tax=Frankia sp. CiP1_Cm_nod1 TaxID=2897160 RepID=UPI0020240B8D
MRNRTSARPGRPRLPGARKNHGRALFGGLGRALLVAAVLVPATWAFTGSVNAASLPGIAGRSGDFNGDGYDDIVSFDNAVGINVAISIPLPPPYTSERTFGPVEPWSASPLTGDEAPLVGDVDGDGRDDVVAVANRGDEVGAVRVALSDGSAFVDAPAWHDSISAGALITPEDTSVVPAAGDFNGDGLTDIAVFVLGGPAAGQVRAALSTGAGFTAPETWHTAFAAGTTVPQTGDFNGDGKDDIVAFTRGAAADVHVAFSDGAGFGPATQLHDYFAAGTELPAVGDFNGDGKDDLVTFTRGTAADVWVSLSTGSGFVSPAVKWQDYFAAGSAFPGVGDFNGDGRDDVVSFTGGSAQDVWVALSRFYWTPGGPASPFWTSRTRELVNYFADAQKWHDAFPVHNIVLGVTSGRHLP